MPSRFASFAARSNTARFASLKPYSSAFSPGAVFFRNAVSELHARALATLPPLCPPMPSATPYRPSPFRTQS